MTKKRLNRRTNKNRRKTEKTKRKLEKKRNKTMKKRGGSLNLDKLPIRYYYPVNEEINNPNTPASITNGRLTTSNINI
jgi:hypothetical protein